MARNKIFVVDDEAGIRFALRDFLETHGYEVEEADSCRAAVALFQTTRPDVALLDYRLDDGNALELLPRLKAIYPTVPLIVLTAHASIDLAVQAIKEGAEQFLTKPLELPTLLVMIQRLLEEQRNRQHQIVGKVHQAQHGIDPFLGSSAAIRQLAEDARKVARSESPVLIQGETGTGKGVLARWLHDHSPRAAEAFVDLNCAGFSQELLETELFGHEKGAFTGALTAKTGLLEVAHGGTVFFDEIGDMALPIQPRLLKVLEEKRFRRLGEVRDRRVDIRLIAATHQDLQRLVQHKAFRSDLYFRINTIPLMVPPLRERQEDILLLAQMFVQTLAAQLGRGAITLTADAEQTLQRHSWPGNIRELRNVLERAILLSDQPLLRRKDLRFVEGTEAAAATDSELSLEELERQHIQRILQQVQGQVTVAAHKLGIPRSTLYQKIKKYQLAIPKPQDR